MARRYASVHARDANCARCGEHAAGIKRLAPPNVCAHRREPQAMKYSARENDAAVGVRRSAELDGALRIGVNVRGVSAGTLRFDPLQLFDAGFDMRQNLITSESISLRSVYHPQPLDDLIGRHSKSTVGQIRKVGRQLGEESHTREVVLRVAPLVGDVLAKQPEHFLGIRPVDKRHLIEAEGAS